MDNQDQDMDEQVQAQQQEENQVDNQDAQEIQEEILQEEYEEEEIIEEEEQKQILEQFTKYYRKKEKARIQKKGIVLEKRRSLSPSILREINEQREEPILISQSSKIFYKLRKQQQKKPSRRLINRSCDNIKEFYNKEEELYHNQKIVLQALQVNVYYDLYRKEEYDNFQTREIYIKEILQLEKLKKDPQQLKKLTIELNECSISENYFLILGNRLYDCIMLEYLNLDISSNYLTDTVLTLMSIGLNRCQQLQYLSLNFNDSCRECKMGFIYLNSAFESFKQLNIFIFHAEGCEITDNVAQDLSSQLGKLKNLIKIDINLSSNSIEDKGFSCFYKNLCYCEQVTDLKLNFSNNLIQCMTKDKIDQGFYNLKRFELNLSYNRIDDISKKGIFRILKYSPKLEELTLQLEQCFLNKHSMSQLKYSMRNIKNLLKLNIHLQSQIVTTCIKTLAEVFSGQIQLEDLYLNISNLIIDKNDLQEIGSSLKSCTNLKSLEICYIPEQLDNQIEIDQFFCQLTYLKQLNKLNLDFSYNLLQMQQITEFEYNQPFQNIQSLTINLSFSQFSNQMNLQILNFFVNNNTLQELTLDLSNLGLNSIDFEQIGNLVKSLTSLRQLCLIMFSQDQHMSGVKQLLKSLIQCKKLPVLDFRYTNSIDEQFKDSIDMPLQNQLYKIKHLVKLITDT